jgi:hypothetical protein
MHSSRKSGLAVVVGAVGVVLAASAHGAGLTITPDRNPAPEGVAVTFTFLPKVAASGDTVSFTFGDGGTGTVTYSTSCAILGGCDSIAHTYAGPGVFAVSGSGTIGGLPVSGSTQVTVTSTPADDELFVPACAHVDGFGGTHWRTTLEVHNPGDTQARFEIALLKFGENNALAIKRNYLLGSQDSISMADILLAEYSFAGTAALRIIPIEGRIMVDGRTYNDQPTGRFGQSMPATRRGEALQHGEQARLIGLSHEPTLTSGYRTAIGLVNASPAEIVVEIELHSRFGTRYGTARSYTLQAYEFRQIERVFELVTPNAVDGGFALVRTTTAGARLFTYASVVDNLTGDPTYVAARVEP